MEAQTNAYTPPTGDLIATSEGFCTPKFLSLNGRIGRARYLAYHFGIGLVLMLGLILVPISSAVGFGILGFGAMILAAYIAGLVFSFGFIVRRLNDLDQSGWLSLLSLVPLVNIGLGLYLLFSPGSGAPNKYGLPPPPNSKGVIATLWSIPVFLVLMGIIAAVTLPAYNEYARRARAAAAQSAIDAPADDTGTTVEDTAAEDAAPAEGEWSNEEASEDSEAVQ